MARRFGKETKKAALCQQMEDRSPHFENIQLPPLLLADLYRQSLVVLDDVQTIGRTAPQRVVEVPALPAVKIEIPAQNTSHTNDSAVQNIPPAIVQQPQTPVPVTPPAQANAPANEKIAFLGGFARKILIVVNEPGTLHLPDDELDMLGKMLTALRFSIADVAIVNIAAQQTNFMAVYNQLPATTSIWLGVEPASLGVPMKFPHFQLQKWMDCAFLYSPALKTMKGDSPEIKQVKRSLWETMKKMFE